MLRLLAALLVCAASAGAQTFSGLLVRQIDDNAVELEFSVASNPGSSTITVAAGQSAGSLTDGISSATSSANGLHWRTFYRAQGGETWYYKITFNAIDLTCPVVCDPCSSSDDTLFGDENGANADPNSGLACGGIGEPPHVTHPNSSTALLYDPGSPVHAVSDAYGLCDGVGETITNVAVADCEADLKTAYDTNRNLGSAGECLSLNVAIPGDGVCTITNWAPSSNNWKAVRIIPSVDSSLYITPHARASLAHLPNLLVLEQDPAELLTGESLTPAPFITSASNMIWQQVWIRSHQEPYAPTTYTVTAANAATPSVTLSDGNCHGLGFGDYLMLNLPGFTSYPGEAYVSSCASGVITLATTVGSFAGTLSSNGTVTLGSNIPIASVAATNPVEITTTVPHGLPDSAQTISQKFLYVGEVNGCDVALGVHNYTIVDANTFSLDGVDGTGCSFAGSPLGFARYTSGPRWEPFTASGKSNVWLLQSIVGAEWYGQFHAGAGMSFIESNQIGFEDGMALGGGQAFLINPATGLAQGWYAGTRTFDAFRIDGVRDAQFTNIGIVSSIGTAHFNAQNFARLPQDITIRAVEAVSPKRGEGGSNFDPYALGLWNNDPRQCSEWKGGVERLSMTGTYCHGAAVGTPFASTAYAHFFSNTVQSDGDPISRYVRDVDMQWNMTKDFGSPFAIGAQATGPRKNQGLNERFRYRHNWHFGDYLHTRINPQAFGVTGEATNNAGYQFSVRMGVSGLTLSDNSIWYVNGAQACNVLVYGGDAFPEALVNRNLLQYHGGCTSPIQSVGGTFTPIDTTNVQTRFESVSRGGSFADNLILRGVENPSTIPACEGDSSDACNKTLAEWSGQWPITGSFNGVTPGPDASTYAARLALIFPGGQMTPAAAYSGYGMADYDTMRRTRGKIANGAITQTSPTALTFSWDAPTTTGCTVRLSAANDDFSSPASNQTASSGSYSQSVSFSGLTAGATYYAYLECPYGETLDWSKQLE